MIASRNREKRPPAILPVLAGIFLIGILHACGNDATGVYNIDDGSGALVGSGFEATKVEMVGGDGQTGTVGNNFGTKVSVRVLDGLDRGLEGVAVRWAVVEGGGTVSQTTSTTNADGIAEQKTWVAGTEVGLNQLTASVDQVGKVTFDANSIPDEPIDAEVFPAQLTTWVGWSTQMMAQVQDQYGNRVGVNVQWRSVDPTVATVSADGVITGMAEGLTEIVTWAGGAEGRATVAVRSRAPASITPVAGFGQRGSVGETLGSPFMVQVIDAEGTPVSFVPLDWEVTEGDATLNVGDSRTDKDGIASATVTLGTQPGQVVVHATLPGLGAAIFYAEASAGEIETVVLTPTDLTLTWGEGAGVEAVVRDRFQNEINTPLIWTSSDEGVVTVQQNGWVFGVSDGTATITAEANGKKGTAEVTVVGQPGDPTLEYEGDRQDGTVGQPLATPLEIRVLDGYGAPTAGAQVVWATAEGAGSIDPAVGATDSEGIARAVWTLGKKAGGQQASASVEGFDVVNFNANAAPGSVKDIEIVPGQASVEMGSTASLVAVARDEYSNVLTTTLDWSSSDPSIVEVSPSGEVTGVSRGQATISAESGDIVGSAQVIVVWTGGQASMVTIGDHQTGPVSAPLSGRVGVQALDGTGAPVAGARVTWVVTAGGGSISGDAETDQYGNALGTWTLGTATGTNRATVSVEEIGARVLTATGVSNTIARIVVSPAAASAQVGGDVQFEAEAQDEYGNTLPAGQVTWASTNPGVAEVSSMGLARGRGVGTAMIQATAGGVTGSGRLQVTSQPQPTGDPSTVSNLSVVSTDGNSVRLRWTEVDDGRGNPAEYAIRRGSPRLLWWTAFWTERSVQGTQVGATMEYTYSGLDPNTQYEFRLVSYRGELNQNATFGGLSNTVSATTGSGSPPPTATVTSVRATPSNVSMSALGNTAHLSAVGLDRFGNQVPNTDIQWTTLDPSVATVTQSGLMTARGVGTGRVVAEATAYNVSDTVIIRVSQDPYRVEISPSTFSLQVNQTRDLTATVRDRNGYAIPGASISWSSSNSSVAMVSSFGRVQARAVGYATIRAQSGGITGTSSLTVSGNTNNPPSRVDLSPRSFELQVNGTQQMTATVRDGNGQVISGASIDEWGSSNTSVATVTSSGLVQARSEGTATIGARSGSVVGTATVTVSSNTNNTPSSLTLLPNSFSLQVNGTQQMTATVRDGNGQVISGASIDEWGSSNTSVATVTSSGLVQARSEGTATIGARSGSVVGTATVTVSSGTQPPPPSNGTPIWADGFESGSINNGGNYHWVGGEGVTNGVSSERARSGQYSLKFLFRGNADPSADATSERRFEFGDRLTEVWVEYYIWIPSNYTHRDPSGGASNNKFFSLWDSGDYPGGGAGRLSVFVGTWAGDAGNSIVSATFSNQEVPTTSAVSQRWTPGITSADRGRWNRVRFHIKVGTHTTGDVFHTQDWGDGLFEMWWNGQRVISHNMPLYDPNDNTFQNGYLLGWANSGFSENTTLYIDDWKVFNSDPGW